MKKAPKFTFLQGRSAWLGTALAQFAVLGFGVISGIVSARLLGPQGRGELAAITLWPMAFAFLASFGFNQAIVFYTGKKRYSVSEVWTTACAIGLAESLIVVTVGIVLMPLLLRHYSEDVRHLGLIFLLASPALILSGIPANMFQGKGDLLRFNLLRLVAPAIYGCGLLALMIQKRPNLTAVIWLLATSYVAALAFGVSVVFRREKPKFHWSSGTTPEFLKYGAKTHLANLTCYFNQRADQLILALLIPPQELGLYAVAVTIATSVNFFSLAAGMVTFSRGSNQSDEALKRTIAKSFRLSLLWLLVACAALFVLAPFLITRGLGPHFAGSIIACRLLLPGIVALGLNQVLYNGANAMGKPTLPSYAEAAGLIVTAIGLYLFVARFGYIGAAIVSTAAYTTSLVVMLVLAGPRMGLSPRQLFFGLRRVETITSEEAVPA